MSYSNRIISGSFWLMISNFGTRFIQMISSIILTRIIEPEEYGLAAISIAIIGIADQVSSLFLETALIQKEREEIESYLNTVWTVNLIRYSLLSLILIILSFFTGTFFGSKRLESVIQVSSVVLIITGFRNVGTIYFRKDLDFKKNFFLEILPMIPSIIFSLILGIILRNVWAFVISSIITNIFSCFLTYKLHPFRPKIELSINKFKDLFNYGKWILWKSILLMIKTNGLNVFIGKSFSINELGYYNRGLAFSYNIFNPFTNVLWQLFYPAFSNINTSDKLTHYLKKTNIFIFLIFSFLIIGCVYFSKEFVYIFLGNNWISIIDIMRFLFILSFISIINTIPNIYFDAIGRPKYNSYILVVESIIIVISIFPLSKIFGIKGVILSLILGQTILIFLYFITLKIVLKLNFIKHIKLLSIILLYPIILIIFTFLLNFLTEQNLIFQFLLKVLLYILFSIFTIYIWDKLINAKILFSLSDFFKQKFPIFRGEN